MCPKINAKASIEDNSCDLQLLDYDPNSGSAHYIINFKILDQEQVENELNDVHNNVAAHITEHQENLKTQDPEIANKLLAILNTVEKGPISKCIY